MHAETLAYMLHWLPFTLKHTQPFSVDAAAGPNAYRQADVPSGVSTPGMVNDAATFGWDNEFGPHQVQVPAFSIDVYKVTNAQYLEFVCAGGYKDRSFWSTEAWEWIIAFGIQHPKFWKRLGNDWFYRTMFTDIPLQPSWPVYVSHAEAEAYATVERSATEESGRKSAVLMLTAVQSWVNRPGYEYCDHWCGGCGSNYWSIKGQ